MIVAQVCDAGLTVYQELTLACVVPYPIKAHVDRFLSFLLDGVVRDDVNGGVVNMDWCGGL